MKISPLKRRPFALAEVCVAIGILGLCIAYVFSTMNQTIRRYATMRDTITCEAIADEYLARTMAAWVTSPPEFSEALKGWQQTTEVGSYTIEVQATPSESTARCAADQPKEVNNMAALLTICLTVTARHSPKAQAARIVDVCVVKEGA
jgi:hypothetical protein